MKKILILLTVLVCGFMHISAQKPISEEAKFSFITCQPGDEVYTKFGHTAIRVEDKVNKIDLVFHWGIFDFNEPNFIWRFMLGTNSYQMGVYSYKNFIREYIARGSAVHAQELNLTPQQADALWIKLWNNYDIENRYYSYKFVFDNCATRPYNLVTENYGSGIRYDYQYNNTTFRDIIYEFAEYGSWLSIGIDIVLGSPTDKKIGTKTAVSFPIYTMEALELCSVNNDSIVVPIIKSRSMLIDAEQKPEKNKLVSSLGFYGRLALPIILTLLLIIYFLLRGRHHMPIVTPSILIVSGLLGLLISFLWFVSSHPLVNNNFNILWLNPLNIFVGILLCVKGWKKTKCYATLISFAISILYLFVIMVGIQSASVHLLGWWLLVSTTLFLATLTYKRGVFRFYNSKK